MRDQVKSLSMVYVCRLGVGYHVAKEKRMNTDFYWPVGKRKGGENNSSCNCSLISFRLTAQPAKSCDKVYCHWSGERLWVYQVF